MTSKDVVKSIAKTLPVVGALAVGVGATMAVFKRDALEDKVYDKLTARQIIKEDIPLQQMEKYIGIDCSSKAVHIVVLDGKEQLIDKYKWSSNLKTADARFLDIVDQIHSNLPDFKDAKLVCVEDSLYIQNPLTTRTITAIVYSIIYFLHHYDINCLTTKPQQWKKVLDNKEVFKKGKAKETIMNYVKNKWHHDDFDEQDYADAACVALYGLRQEKEKDNGST